MPSRFDVAVVGAGPAGSCAAIRLAARGARVVLLDRARFPRDKPCGGGVTVRGTHVLPVDITPVVERVVTHVDVRVGHDGAACTVDGDGPLVLMTQRRRLDMHLAEAAVAAGADFRDGTRVRGIAVDGHGVRIRTDAEVIEAAVMVGADGCNGVSRAALGAGEPSYAVALEGNLARGTAGFDDERYTTRALLELNVVRGGYGWVFPKDDHVNVGVGGYHPEGPHLRELLRVMCEAHGVPPDALTGLRGHRLPIRRSGATVATPRALLVGDAAGLVDPFSGDGMYEAFTSSAIAAECIGDLLDGRVADLRAYPDRLGQALGPHVAVAWTAKLLAERTPGLVMALLRTPRVRGIVGARMRAHPRRVTSPRGMRAAALVSGGARRALGPDAA
ncbi:MAG: NAD(P)/FAD-dependent oxidoreductase [Thermoleophilia bacterium]